MIGTGKRLYLDYNASAPLLDEARIAIIEALGIPGNPSSVHREGRAARGLVESARRSVAALVNAKSDHVFFTSGATEAASTLLTPNYMMGRAPVRMSHLYVSATEHPCMLAGGQFAPENITILAVDENGVLKLDVLQQALDAHDKAQACRLLPFKPPITRPVSFSLFVKLRRWSNPQAAFSSLTRCRVPGALS